MSRSLFLAVFMIIASTASAQWERVDSDPSLPPSLFPVGMVFDGTYLYLLHLDVSGQGLSVRLFRSADSGTSWTEMTGFPPAAGGAPEIFTVVDGTLVFVAHGGLEPFVHVGTSTDAGVTWSIHESSDIDNPVVDGFAGSGSTWYVTSRTDIAVTTDSGVSWSVLAAPPGNDITSLFSHESVVFARADQGIHRSTDTGASWTRINILESGSNNFSWMWTSGGDLYMKDERTIYRSEDSGATWTTHASISSSFTSVLSWPGSDTWVYPHSVTFSTSTDLGITVSAVPLDGFPMSNAGQPCMHLAPILSPDYIFVVVPTCAPATGYGLYRYRYVTNTVTESQEVPRSLTVDAPYPNPVAKSVSIPVTQSEAGIVRLQVFDLMGRDVLSESGTFRPAGVYNLGLDVSDLPSGMYWIDVRIGAESIVKPIAVYR